MSNVIISDSVSEGPDGPTAGIVNREDPNPDTCDAAENNGFGNGHTLLRGQAGSSDLLRRRLVFGKGTRETSMRACAKPQLLRRRRRRRRRRRLLSDHIEIQNERIVDVICDVRNGQFVFKTKGNANCQDDLEGLASYVGDCGAIYNVDKSEENYIYNDLISPLTRCDNLDLHKITQQTLEMQYGFNGDDNVYRMNYIISGEYEEDNIYCPEGGWNVNSYEYDNNCNDSSISMSIFNINEDVAFNILAAIILFIFGFYIFMLYYLGCGLRRKQIKIQERECDLSDNSDDWINDIVHANDSEINPIIEK